MVRLSAHRLLFVVIQLSIWALGQAQEADPSSSLSIFPECAVSDLSLLFCFCFCGVEVSVMEKTKPFVDQNQKDDSTNFGTFVDCS